MTQREIRGFHLERKRPIRVRSRAMDSKVQVSCTVSKSFCSSTKNEVGGEEIVEKKDKKLSKAMRAYIERSRTYNEFIKKEEMQYNVGKRHLANIMGRDPETFTQTDIDEAIEYLFPSGIFEKKARPFMKPPQLVFPPRKDAQFDESGRPYHYLFYTGKPNFYHLMHELVSHMKSLDRYEDEIFRKKRSDENLTKLVITGSEWLSKQELENKIVEELKDVEYKNFIYALDRLVAHKYSYRVKDFIMEQRKALIDTTVSSTPVKPLVNAEGKAYVLTKDCPRKNARADVTVLSPGTGLIKINGQGIEYFQTTQGRNQILFPLELTGMRNSVDIEANVKGGGETGQAGAIRWGIAWGLRSFVSSEVIENMRLAGLLTRDFRRRERKKPGQAKARKKFTWKKR